MTDSSPRLPIHPFLAQEDLMIWAHEGPSDKLVLCFSGIGGNKDSVPPIEFAKIATGNGKHSALFISDPNRTWLNGPMLIERITETAKAFANQVNAQSIITLGHSMGGYSAIIIGRFVQADIVVSYSPQFSVNPAVINDESRWKRARNKIQHHTIESIAPYIIDDIKYFIFHGAHKSERPQRDRIPIAPNIFHWIVPNVAHAVPRHLRNMNRLTQITNRSMNSRFRALRLAMESIGGHQRTLKEYPALNVTTPVSAPKAKGSNNA